MYRALYAFENDNADNVLSCKAGDRFTVLENSDEHWWLVQNGKGQLGYVPANYLAIAEAGDNDVLQLIDHAIKAVQQQIQDSAGIKSVNNKKLKETLKKLQIHRSTVVVEHQRSVSSSTKRRAPVAPDLGNSESQQSSRSFELSSVDKNNVSTSAKAPPTNDVAELTHVPKVPPRDSSKQGAPDGTRPVSSTLSAEYIVSNVPVGLGAEMVERIRLNTGLSYANSRIAVASILKLLGERVPGTLRIVGDILEALDNTNDQDETQNEGSDAVQLCKIFQQLESIKDDSQQRSWFLHEDEPVICRHLEDLLSILSSANPAVCRKVFVSNGYTACHNLAQYYQMETRLSIRLLLLQVFCTMCSLEEKIVSELLNSVLPLELARDIQADLTDVQKVAYSSLVLAMVFSTGEAVPLQYYEHLNSRFVEFLLDMVETPLAQDEAEELPDVFVKLILAFNLHFELPDENPVMMTLAERRTAKNFTEKLLLLFNREDDPTHMFLFQSESSNSVIKFLSDMFSCQRTASLLYTNDAKVLIDIVVRQLSDLSPGDRMRTEYLSLMHLLLSNSDYAEHLHRQSELSSCFVRIFREDRDGIEMDRDIVRQIWQQFPQLFRDSN